MRRERHTLIVEVDDVHDVVSCCKLCRCILEFLNVPISINHNDEVGWSLLSSKNPVTGFIDGLAFFIEVMNLFSMLKRM